MCLTRINREELQKYMFVKNAVNIERTMRRFFEEKVVGY